MAENSENYVQTITGQVKKKFPKANVGETYESQQLIVVTESEEYPQTFSIEMQKNTYGYLDPIVEGDNVQVTANIKGREWVNPQGESKYFTTLVGFKIAKK